MNLALWRTLNHYLLGFCCFIFVFFLYSSVYLVLASEVGGEVA